MSFDTLSTDVLVNEISPFLTLKGMNPTADDDASGNKGYCQTETADENSDQPNSYSAADQVISYYTERSSTSDDSCQLPMSAEETPGLVNMANKSMIYSGEFAKTPCSSINKTISDYCLKLSKQPKQVCIPTRLLYQNNSILKLKPIRDTSLEGSVPTLMPVAPVMRLQKVISLNTKAATNSPQTFKHTPAILGGKKEKQNVVKTLLLKSILPSTIKMVAKRVSISGFSAVTPSSGIYSVAQTHTQKAEILNSCAPKMTPLVLPTSQTEIKHSEIMPASNISVKPSTSVNAHHGENSPGSVHQQTSSTEKTAATTPSRKGQRNRNAIATKMYEESKCEDITDTKTTIAFVLTTRKHRKILPKEGTDEKPKEDIAELNGKTGKVLWTRKVKIQQQKAVLKSSSFDVSPSSDGSECSIGTAGFVGSPPVTYSAGASSRPPDKLAVLPYKSAVNETVPYSHMSNGNFGSYNQGNYLNTPENESRWCNASNEWGYANETGTQGCFSPVSNYKTQLMQYLQGTVPKGEEKLKGNKRGTKGCGRGRRRGKASSSSKSCIIRLERERPYICYFCGKSEQYKAILQRHLLVQHQIQVPINK